MADFALPPRSGKPRTRGLTSMIDFGPDTFGWTGGEHGIRALLECAADYIDFAKIYAMNALLLPPETVKRAARAYRDADIAPFAGGILFEYAWQKGQVPEMMRHIHDLGLTGIELSENYITLSSDQRRREIERLQRGGLKVVYEFGRKNPLEPMSFDYVAGLVDEVACLGLDHVTVEQCEIDLLAKSSADALARLPRQPWFERILIEVDPYRFPQQHAQMIRDFGPEVNLANVTPGQVLRLEGFRRGIGRAMDYSLLAR
ncbi:MAG: phosphosulfolactate synthase [Burkholderiales bacterium]|nr:phosphosulfolactate synthase [Burkholderiales bacterium]